MDKSLILKEIKKAFGFESDASFARFLGISPQTLASWYRRNVFDPDTLYQKCKDLNPDFLLSGSGSVMRNGDVYSTRVGDHNTNSGNIASVDDRLLRMLEEASAERMKLHAERDRLLSIIESLTDKSQRL